jgi:hypothetical protein
MKRLRLPIWCPLFAQLRFLAVAVALFPCVMSVSVVVVPMLTLAESNETSENRSNSRERSEELTLDTRGHQVRQLLIEHPRGSVELIYPVAPKITQRQRGLTDVFHGHRLSHDLLAPMTC